MAAPAYTSFLIASQTNYAVARAVAERYPWVDAYTPVNEPLTTARFSALYGHWHPHSRDSKTFIRVLLTQIRAVVTAMHAIREINRDAQLIQTEDLGKTFSTRQLAYQAEFENERRWLTYDLLRAAHARTPFVGVFNTAWHQRRRTDRFSITHARLVIGITTI